MVRYHSNLRGNLFLLPVCREAGQDEVGLFSMLHIIIYPRNGNSEMRTAKWEQGHYLNGMILSAIILMPLT